MNAAQFAALPFPVAKRGSAVHSGCLTARGADDREAIPSSILDDIWATGISSLKLTLRLVRPP
jgi:hypothetical protein